MRKGDKKTAADMGAGGSRKDDQPLLGFCPIGKFVFSHEDAMRQKAIIEKNLSRWGIRYVGLEGAVRDGMIRSQTDVDAAVEHFRKKNIDAVFMPHCNFGTEGAVGMIGSKLGVPVLLWGPRDEAPLADGTRLRDSLCGLFASSKVLHKLGVPFTYVENCQPDAPALQKGLRDFIGAANVAKVFRKGVRIGHIGQRIDFFWTTIINESELLERFRIEICPVDMVKFIRSAKKRAQNKRKEYLQELSRIRKTADISGFDDETPMLNVLGVRDEMLEIAEKENLAGFAFQDFMSVIEEMGAYCYYAEGAVADRYPFGYESDIHGTISDILLRSAAMNSRPAYLADLTIRHPEDDNGILLWHGGAPLSFCHPREKVGVGGHWILPSPLSGMTHFRMLEGKITVCRFDGDRGEYRLAVGQGHSMEGPATRNNYVWMKVDDWPAWERKLIEGPFIHHVAMSYGHFGDALCEACKYVPGLTPLRLDSVTRN